MTYKIEKNIPLVTERFPFSEMEEGDSFLISDGGSPSTAHAAARRANIKIATKKTDQGVRVWLIKKGNA